MKKRLLGLAVAVLLSQSGCLSTPSSQPQMTDEQRAQAEAARQKFIERMLAGNQSSKTQQTQQNLTVNTQPVKTLSPEQLIEQVKGVTNTGNAATFSVERDGIQINNTMFLDPEGNIENAGWNNSSGHFTYIVSNPSGDATLKFFRAGSTASPLSIATITPQRNGYHIRTIDNQVATGNAIIPTSDGFIVSRENSVFRYTIGQAVSPIALPRGWSIASLQRGDVDSTGLILLEKSAKLRENENKGFRGLISGLPGTAAVTDYALFDLSTQKTYLLNMSKSQNEVQKYSNCERQNAVLNKCGTMHSYESLYQPDGRKNRLHYFWALDWFNTSVGPLATYNSGTRIYVVDIVNDKKLTLFSRTLGINDFNVSRAADGSVALEAQLGLSKIELEDLVKHLATNTFEVEASKSI